jgi:hypothetical protein
MPSVALEGRQSLGKVYCTLCTRTVDAEITIQSRTGSRDGGLRVTSGQKCPRCTASLDAAFVIANSLARTA